MSRDTILKPDGTPLTYDEVLAEVEKRYRETGDQYVTVAEIQDQVLSAHPSAGKCVIVESPYSPGPKPKDPCACTAMNVLNMTDCNACEALGAWREKLLENIAYGRACMADCLARGEAPFASHLLYTQAGVLDDDVLAQRTWGIQAGFFWRSRADKTVVYTDRGTSKGMQLGIDDAVKMGHVVEYRTLNKDVK